MAASKVALQKVTIKELDPNLGNVLIVGIIIGKQRPRKFSDSKVAENVCKGVWNFTVRDTPQDYINITYWGSSEETFQVNNRFRTGDVVEIGNPKITVRQHTDYGEQFRPMVTSPFHLTLNERSSLAKHDGNIAPFLRLLRFPTKPIAGYLPIRDVHNSGASIDKTVDILGVIRGLQNVRSVTTKTGENLQVRTIEVFDHTSPTLKFEIWEPDIISRSSNWQPRFTAVFFTDVRIVYSNFEKDFIAKVTSRTIVTENPLGKDVETLLNYAKNAPIETFEIVDQLISALPDPNTIQDVMSVKQVKDKIISLAETVSGSKQFTALIYSFVSSLDLDGLTKILTVKCAHCQVLMKRRVCENVECPTVFEKDLSGEPEVNFDMKIKVSDHTGTLTNCRLSGQAAEQALGCTARAFFNMSDDEKCTLKWKYLMERCEVRIAVLFLGKQTPIISVIKLNLANKLEVARKLPVY